MKNRSTRAFAAFLLLVAGCAARTRPPSAPLASPTIVGSASTLEHSFRVTAYCETGRTASGDRTASGVAAADPRVLPIGSTIRVSGLRSHNGVYHVKDAGPRIRGRILDLYLPSCADAKRFGRQSARVALMR